jgi:DNA polymerase III alpha subunit
MLRRAMGKKKVEEMAKQREPLHAKARRSAASGRRRPRRSST